ncbi:MAG: urea ABC transporter substrate-binding protein [Crenarchaeota archaeon]|nr:MAG: urea ABC transporter substrate-binding protein [Thermoproteota archaeon]RDJ33458.1 MAG: urea ABC transporter substrate-binding protein [Thermoproteota archaeon]RDJ36554.1 MAG: urea ABC transporter substrate-binding protein [Thermoproteota archaeon]RDJ39283.1 MAG: urea ABC transporter substrate-binding protein [Thermoproteota archaeon]
MDKVLATIAIIGVFILAATALSLYNLNNEQYFQETLIEYQPKSYSVPIIEDDPIKIGIIHSLTGTMAISEKPVVDSTLLAIKQLNDRGGILGRKVTPIVLDGQSDWNTFANQAEHLIVQEEVDVIFGGWTSASRKTMLPVIEKYDHLLFYPVQYEGLEQSPNIVYTGAAPNQQVIPAVIWAHQNLGERFFLVGSDYVFPRSANEIIKHQIEKLGGEVVGEEYKLLGEKNFDDVIEKISTTNPSVILNTINGDSNVYFFKTLRNNGLTSENIPTISFSIAEDEIRHIGAEYVKGDYASWNYFQSLENESNRDFVTSFKNEYGQDRVTDDPMEAAYNGIFLYAKAVEKAETTSLHNVRNAIKGLTLSAPEGTVGIDPTNQHLAKVIRIGQILDNGQFKIVASSEDPIRPIPYPDYHSKSEWDEFLNDLYVKWDGNWANPGIVEMDDV